ncbi:thiol:disulfide interchange protein [Buchnera aphidicola (Hyperomyzus lactucae)]|uniref:Thiol:disulfide interchange protein n=1 Tax=Buchnera aphidicola (Hyperomyzus lactucae) TaxID=1241860 RepID=A0A4D6YA31_9GAMM|nr:DsbA family protein [Buchnera aphidicola]QCI21145.1 thiol:disulfide interchange protein [Buchnera aphidicola (Hyperomyzus lactucae)]
MKKILIIICSIFLSCNTSAYEFHNQKDYIIKHKSIHNVPKVMDFFSFFCPYCYEFKKIHNTKSLIKNINVQTYHVNFFGGELSHILTKSWIIAEQIGIEEKIVLPIFKAIQETHTINNIDSIKKIFKKDGGVSEKKFNNFWNSLTLKILVQKKNKDVEKSNLDHVPTMLIHGKYIIDYAKIENAFKENFSQKYIELIQFLIKKK